MELEQNLSHWIGLTGLGIEILAVVIIVAAIVYATLRFLYHSLTRPPQADAYERYKHLLGRTLLLGLEILVAADVVRTVVLEPTLGNVAALGLLVIVRTFLSWTLVVEIEGRWPWQRRPASVEEHEEMV